MDHLRGSAGRDDVSTSEVEQLVGMVLDVADRIGPLLDRIPLTFKQYTEHNIGHSRNLVYLMGKFIPQDTLRTLNGVELAILVLSALLHDAGMHVTEQEKELVVASEEFRWFQAVQVERNALLEKARTANEHVRAGMIMDAIQQ
ncbi:MAG TPA: hypothetical protein VHG91_21225 [Longimicrobium sp.]|nr:hypothetical protein [Longimicrobium sp.]